MSIARKFAVFIVANKRSPASRGVSTSWQALVKLAEGQSYSKGRGSGRGNGLAGTRTARQVVGRGEGRRRKVKEWKRRVAEVT